MRATQQMVIDSVVEDFPRSANPDLWRDLPAIRQALNDRIDYYQKEGQLSRAVSDRWSQDRMVKAVQKGLQ